LEEPLNRGESEKRRCYDRDPEESTFAVGACCAATSSAKGETVLYVGDNPSGSLGNPSRSVLPVYFSTRDMPLMTSLKTALNTNETALLIQRRDTSGNF